MITGVTVSGKTATITLNNALASGKKITITSVKRRCLCCQRAHHW
ncbi:MAG: hypothetical protein ACLU38_13485 [Dysosmobacter sp.]